MTHPKDCYHPDTKRINLVDGSWSVCSVCDGSIIRPTARENALYEVFKARFLKELKVARSGLPDNGYELVSK